MCRAARGVERARGQQGRHLPQQLVGRERFAHHVVRPRASRAFHHVAVEHAGDEEDGRLAQPRMVPDVVADLEAVPVGHDHIAHHQIRLVSLDPLDGLAAGPHRENLNPFRPQAALHHLAHAQAVVGH
jgi:hypothetical protein